MDTGFGKKLVRFILHYTANLLLWPALTIIPSTHCSSSWSIGLEMHIEWQKPVDVSFHLPLELFPIDCNLILPSFCLIIKLFSIANSTQNANNSSSISKHSLILSSGSPWSNLTQMTAIVCRWDHSSGTFVRPIENLTRNVINYYFIISCASISNRKLWMI